jgi:hypothetical protein
MTFDLRLGNISFLQQMKTTLTLLAAVLLLSRTQAALPAPPHPATDFPVLIEVGGSPGSGFVLEAGNARFIVTSRHNLLDDSRPVAFWKLKASSATVTGISPQQGKDSVEIKYTLNLAGLLASKNLRFSTNHDVALIRFQELTRTDKRPGNYNVNVIKVESPYGAAPEAAFQPVKANACKRFKDLHVASEVMSFVFPESIGLQVNPRIDSRKPLLRKGMVARLDTESETVILDTAAYGGASGGPVIVRDGDNVASSGWSLVGIQSESLPFQEGSENSRLHGQSSNYSVVEPMDAILDLVW